MARPTHSLYLRYPRQTRRGEFRCGAGTQHPLGYRNRGQRDLLISAPGDPPEGVRCWMHRKPKVLVALGGRARYRNKGVKDRPRDRVWRKMRLRTRVLTP